MSYDYKHAYALCAALLEAHHMKSYWTLTDGYMFYEEGKQPKHWSYLPEPLSELVRQIWAGSQGGFPKGVLLGEKP